MAIYHFRASVISRSAGRSATAATAYRAGEKITDRRTGLEFDYSKRSGVDHVEILAPSNSPDWVHNRSELWNRVEESETRKNSQVAREVRVALPAELSHEQRVELVRDFCQREFVDRGMVADIAVHAPGRDGDDRNHHAHIMLTTREIDASGFTTKNRDWNAKDQLEAWREGWGREANTALERAGASERIDHRTLEAQRDEALERAAEARERGDEQAEVREMARSMELDRDPLPQLSPGAWQMKERGVEVTAVAVWREVKQSMQAAKEVAREFLGNARTWLREASRPRSALDRLQEARGGEVASRSRSPESALDRLKAAREAGEAPSSRSVEQNEDRARDQLVEGDREKQRQEQEKQREIEAQRQRGASRGMSMD